GKSAMLKELSLNGVSIVKDSIFPDQPGQAVAPLRIQVQQGSLGLRELYYLAGGADQELESLEANVAFKPGALHYRYFEGGPWEKLPNFTQLTAVKAGTSDYFKPKQLAQREQQYALVYEGTITVAQAGKYTLGVSSDDGVRVWWDEQVVLEHDGVHGMKEKKKEVEMAPGEHRLKVEYFQGKGGSGLEMFYEGQDLPRTPLYSPSASTAQAKLDLPPATEIASDEFPYVFRAFIAYPSQQNIKMPLRRTHGVAVGEAQGPHYTVDLSLGSLLTFWRGRFGQAGKLWIGRGESQQFVPLGNPLDRSGRPDFAFLDNAQALWPDSLEAYQSVLQFDRYELNEQGRPQFYYATAAGGEVSDLLLPEGEALLRQLTADDLDEAIWHQVAQGEEIENLGEGSYLVQGPGYRLDLLEGEGVQLYLRSTGQGQELLAKLGGSSSSLRYQISW
ncbi:MAG: PA14 domain-containing protein, partial [Bacteroidota bacterium]